MSAQLELWRVSTAEGVFETNLETLKQWITEGCVLPTDKVSKGNLNWIDAGRAPMLKNAFSGERTDQTALQPGQVDVVKAHENVTDVQAKDHSLPLSVLSGSVSSAESCHHHANSEPTYVCRMCGKLFCQECIRILKTIALCPLCGDLCTPYARLKAQAAAKEFQSSNFGLQDFATAVCYPLQDKVSLLFGALVYGFMLLGGFRTALIAYVIMFGCMTQSISQVAWGRLNRSFMPDFSEFSVLEDLNQTVFLGIAITLVSWGPVIVLLVALFFGDFAGAPGTPVAGQIAPSATSTGPTHEDLATLTDPNADPKKLEEASRKLNQIRPGAEINREAERTKQQDDPILGSRLLVRSLGAGILIGGLLLIAIAWAVFYYPMALAVAGYTQSIGSVLNPLVGLDTIRRMGGTYFKAFGMVLVLQAVSLAMAIVVGVITAPLALPFLGNLPAKFIDGTITFYFNLIIACLLGLSLYKCADKLGINVD